MVYVGQARLHHAAVNREYCGLYFYISIVIKLLCMQSNLEQIKLTVNVTLSRLNVLSFTY